MPCWVAFNEIGRQVFCTYEEHLATFRDMEANGGYDISRCSIERVDDYDYRSGLICEKDLQTGIIRMVPIPEKKTSEP